MFDNAFGAFSISLYFSIRDSNIPLAPAIIRVNTPQTKCTSCNMISRFTERSNADSELIRTAIYSIIKIEELWKKRNVASLFIFNSLLTIHWHEINSSKQLWCALLQYRILESKPIWIIFWVINESKGRFVYVFFHKSLFVWCELHVFDYLWLLAFCYSYGAELASSVWWLLLNVFIFLSP